MNTNVKWEWLFDDATSSGANDTADTLLGDMIAARGTTTDHKFVHIETTTNAAGGTTTETVTGLTISNDNNDYTVKKGESVVANLHTAFDISLTVTQID